MIPRLALDLPKSLATIVEERIRSAIIDAELSFGQALPEDEMGVSMGVSRTPMREALGRLQLQGLVVIVPKKGTFVFEPSLEDVKQLANFRLMVESHGVENCLANAPGPTLRDLTAAFEAMERALAAADPKAYARADTNFHDSFFTNCGNTYLTNAYRTISGRVAAIRAHLSVPRTAEQDVSFGEHRQMIEEFGLGKQAAVIALLEKHILRAATVYEEMIQDRLR